MTVWIRADVAPALRRWMKDEARRRLQPALDEAKARIEAGADVQAEKRAFERLIERTFFELEAEAEQLARDSGLVLDEDVTLQ